MPRRSRFQVGVIGLGVIGSRVAAVLRQQGHQVFVWNRSPRREPCFLGSPAAVAQSAKILQVFVSDDDAVLGLVDTLGEALTSEHIFLCHATISPETTRQAAAAVEKRGAKFLDAPFTGSREAAENSQLTYYIGGEPFVLERVRAILQVSSQQIVHLGKVGDASLIKIACNLVAATQLQGVTEALALVAASQIPPSKFVEAMKHNGAASPLVSMKLPRIIAQNFEPHFALKHMFKDMQHAVRAGERVGLQLPVADVTRSLLFEGLKEGWGDLDFAALARHYFEAADRALEEKAEPEAGIKEVAQPAAPEQPAKDSRPDQPAKTESAKGPRTEAAQKPGPASGNQAEADESKPEQKNASGTRPKRAKEPVEASGDKCESASKDSEESGIVPDLEVKNPSLSAGASPESDHQEAATCSKDRVAPKTEEAAATDSGSESGSEAGKDEEGDNLSKAPPVDEKSEKTPSGEPPKKGLFGWLGRR